jgi:stage II sporulation protein AA (anti-sigma F factor antagonist)
MLSQELNRWLEVEQAGDVAIVRFKIPWILKEGTIETIGDTLYDLAENSGCRKFILNFGNVKSLASTMFGKLTALHQRIEGRGGRLALCCIDPGLDEVFQAVKLIPLLTVFESEQEALRSL